MEDDDFTFPTVATSSSPGGTRQDDGPAAALPAARLGDLPRPDFAAPRASPLWPFAAPPTAAAPATALKEEEAPAPASASARGEAQEEEDERERAATADEERMDPLWEGTGAATAAPAPRRGGHAEPERRRRAAEPGEETVRSAASYNERMDLLWESFNEDLLLRRAGSKAAADHLGGVVALPGLDPDWYLCHSPSDAESEETSASSPAREGYGCAPTMLRASSRAGGAGQFCSSPRRRRSRGRGAAAGWALLLRLFRRLFAVDKPAASRRHGGIYVS